jgi:hypothetical protein
MDEAVFDAEGGESNLKATQAHRLLPINIRSQLQAAVRQKSTEQPSHYVHTQVLHQEIANMF